jgi:LysR family hydrogen peroxide-inducible transcriptional activator
MADLKLKDLRYLAALAETRHFGQAAAACCVSQPTLSAQLRKLENYLGVQLVERQPRRVLLTEAGAAVAARWTSRNACSEYGSFSALGCVL